MEEQDNNSFILAKNILFNLHQMAEKAIIHHNEYLNLNEIEPGNYNFAKFEPTYILSEDKKSSLLKEISIAYACLSEKRA